MPYHITEPHPSRPQNTRIHTGIGGFGNVVRTPAHASRNSTPRTASLAKVPTVASVVSTTSIRSGSKFSAGRGGAGNIRNLNEAALYDFEEQLKEIATREERHVQHHVGRGGAGNFASVREAERRGSNLSVSSDGSARSSGFFRRISGVFDRA